MNILVIGAPLDDLKILCKAMLADQQGLRDDYLCTQQF